MRRAALIAAITGSRRESFQAALSELTTVTHDDAGLRFVIEVGEEFVRRGEISEREQARRFSVVLSRIAIHPDHHVIFARSARHLARPS